MIIYFISINKFNFLPVISICKQLGGLNMKIHILEQVLEYDNAKNILDDMFEEIDKIINNSKLVLSQFIIDGQIIYNDFHDYFLNNINNINEVLVNTQTHKEALNEIIRSTLDYVEMAIPQLKVLSDEFYAAPTTDTWNKMSDFLEGIQWVISTFSSIDGWKNLNNIVKDYEVWNRYAKEIFSLREIIVEFEEVLENNDMVSIGDILAYEIEPIFKSMEENLCKLVY